MLAPKRRFQGLVLVAILCLVMLGSLLPDPFVIPPPGSPTTPIRRGNLGDRIAEARNYYYTHMKFVALAPLLRGLIKYELGASSSPKVYIGRNHHLFYAAEYAPDQSAGAIYRKPETFHFINMATVLKHELGRLGAKLVIAFPPNAQSVPVGDLPFWSKPHPPLEYDLAISELRQLGITTVDLKTPMLQQEAASQNGASLYRLTDTHWSNAGAVLAFNLVVEGAGFAQWKVDPASALGPVSSVPSGDLARFIGIQPYLTDHDTAMAPAPENAWRKLDILRSPPYAGVFDTYAFEREATTANQRVLVLGDSFTQSFWLKLLQRIDAQRVGWMHHGICGFDFADVERFEPTLVILAPTERAMPCALSSWPLGLPRASK